MTAFIVSKSESTQGRSSLARTPLQLAQVILYLCTEIEEVLLLGQAQSTSDLPNFATRHAGIGEIGYNGAQVSDANPIRDGYDAKVGTYVFQMSPKLQPPATACVSFGVQMSRWSNVRGHRREQDD